MSIPNSPDSFIFSSEEEREELKQIKEEKETASDKNSDSNSKEDRKEDGKQKIKKEKKRRIIYDSTNSETDSYEKMENVRKQKRKNENEGRKQKRRTESEGRKRHEYETKTKGGKKHNAKRKEKGKQKNRSERKENRLIFDRTDDDSSNYKKVDKKKGKNNRKKAKETKNKSEQDKKRDHGIEKVIKREEEDESECERKYKRMKTSEEKIAEVVERKKVTQHHSFVVNCTRCEVEVYAKDLGDAVISPSCINWAVECSDCSGSNPIVTRYGKYSLQKTVLRALFLLHVKNPQREYWGISEVAKIMRSSCAEDFKTATKNSEKFKSSFTSRIGIVLARFTLMGTLKNCDKGLYMYVYPLTNSNELSSTPIAGAKPGHSENKHKGEMDSKGKQPLPPTKFPQQTTLKSAARNMSITEIFNNMRERDQPEPSAHQTLRTLPVLQEVFVGWMGKEEFVGFVIVNLDLPLKALRSEIMEDHIVENNEFLFYYKMSPVQVCQETKMLIRACVTENNGSFHVRLVCFAKK